MSEQNTVDRFGRISLASGVNGGKETTQDGFSIEQPPLALSTDVTYATVPVTGVYIYICFASLSEPSCRGGTYRVLGESVCTYTFINRHV